MKNILIFCTRSLCYFSGEFFAEELAEIFRKKGDNVETVLLPDEAGSTAASRDLSQFAILEKYVGKTYDAIIDFNSFLPYLSDEDGTLILDEIDAPFFNYLLDHPLYHHPGLSYKLRNYNVICIDKKHAEYVRKYYPHIKKIIYRPLPGAKSACSFEKKSERLFFSGTYMPETELMAELSRRPEIIRRAVLEILDVWNPEDKPIEDAVWNYLDGSSPEKMSEIFNSVIKNNIENTENSKIGSDFYTAKTIFSKEGEERYFPLLMNYMYSLDRIMRYRMRRKVITALAEAGIEMDIQGEGWEKLEIPQNDKAENSDTGSNFSEINEGGSGIFAYKNVHYIPPVPMKESIKEIARHQYILDINPLFFEGLHDRVSTAFVNGCEVFSNMNPKSVPAEFEIQFHHYSVNDMDLLIQNLRAKLKG